MQDANNLFSEFVKGFGFEPTNLQNELLRKLADFVLNGSRNDLFLMKGYAGTGKTTIVSTVVNNLGSVNLKAVLLPV